MHIADIKVSGIKRIKHNKINAWFDVRESRKLWLVAVFLFQGKTVPFLFTKRSLTKISLIYCLKNLYYLKKLYFQHRSSTDLLYMQVID